MDLEKDGNWFLNPSSTLCLKISVYLWKLTCRTKRRCKSCVEWECPKGEIVSILGPLPFNTWLPIVTRKPKLQGIKGKRSQDRILKKRSGRIDSLMLSLMCILSISFCMILHWYAYRLIWVNNLLCIKVVFNMHINLRSWLGKFRLHIQKLF